MKKTHKHEITEGEEEMISEIMGSIITNNKEGFHQLAQEERVPESKFDRKISEWKRTFRKFKRKFFDEGASYQTLTL